MDKLLLTARVVHSVLSAREQGFILGLEFVAPPRQAVSLIQQYMDSLAWV